MASKRIYEFAKENNVTSKEVLKLAKDQGLEYGSHMSSMTPEEEKKLKTALKAPKASKNESQKQDKNADKKADKKADKQAHTGQKQGKAAKKDSSNTQQDKQQKSKKKADTQRQTNNAHRGQDVNEQRGGRRRNRRGRGRRNNNQKADKGSGLTQRKFKELPEKLVYTEGMNIQEIAKLIHRDTSEIIMKLMGLGVMANQNQALSKDVIELIAIEYGIEPEEKVVVDASDLDIYFQEEEDEADLELRPAVVTIMGHVDHGKTTLLDQLRQARVAEGEAGGITQHIGAYQVEAGDQMITFLDTPGHEAFTTMRARGADVTDIAIIVVAANDGVMPQTVEAINHAKAADVPIIIAVNKIDLPEANPDRVKQELSEYGIISEDWGGDNIFVEISAKFNQNIDELLEMVLLVAEVAELKANPHRLALGSVIEARLDKAQGSTATLLVQAGTLKVGDPIVVGNTHGRVRTMTNDQGRRIQEAGPSTPVEITGLNDAPQAGDLFVVFDDEKTARQVGEERASRAQEKLRRNANPVTLENLFETLQEGELKSVSVIIKGDVQGSVEALAASLQKIEVEGVRVDIVHRAVGAINESDIALATASGAIVIGFNVRATPQARATAESEDVEIRTYRVIYDAIDEIETAMKGMLDPEYEEQVTGEVVVRETYTVSKLGTIAGAYVLNGVIERSSQVRVIRDNIVIHDGELASLKRFKDDAKEVTKGYECGIMIENFNDIKVDDIIEPYKMVEIKRK